MVEGYFEGLYSLLVLEKPGMRSAVRINKSVDAEVSVVRVVTEVTAIGEVRICVAVVADRHRVIGEFPYASSAERIVCEDQIPVFFEVSGPVAHCVAVFAEIQRLFEIGVIYIVIKHIARRWIHTAFYVNKIALDVVAKVLVLTLYSR